MPTRPERSRRDAQCPMPLTCYAYFQMMEIYTDNAHPISRI
ncbi:MULTISPECIES: hypothetical protein [unclassified Calothrix]|nr:MULTISPECIES: hypothetical protein [unclassified Calothrix]